MADANASDPPLELSDTLEVGFAGLPVSVLKLGATTLLVLLGPAPLRAGSVCLNGSVRWAKWSPAGFRLPRSAAAG